MAETGSETQGTRDIRLSRVSLIAAIASSTHQITAMTRLVNTGNLQPPIHIENRFEALMNVGEESPNVTKHGSNQPAANIATNRTLEVKQTAAHCSERSRAQDSDSG